MNLEKSIVLESGTPLHSSQQEPANGLWDRVALLPREEQVVLELSLKGGASNRQIARLLNRSPGSISRHLRQLGRRLHDPLVIALLDPACPLEPAHRQIAVERYLCHCSMPELSARHGNSCARIRRVLALVRAWHRGISDARRSRYV